MANLVLCFIKLYDDRGLICSSLLSIFIIHALVNEGLGIKFFSYFDTELQMLAHKVLELLGSYLLPLLFIEDIIVVLDYLVNRAPKLLHHATHVDSFLPQLDLLVLQLLLFTQLLFLKLLFARTSMLLRISHLLFSFSFEVLGHPFHFFEQKRPMTLCRLLLLIYIFSRLHLLADV